MHIVSHNTPSFKPQQTQSERQQQQQLALLQRIVRKFYFIHLLLIAIIYTYLIISQKKLHHHKLSFTFIILTIYCSMIVWNWIINFLLVIFQKQNVAVVFNRVIIRFIIMLFLPLGLTALIIDNYFGVKLILALIIYMCLISLLFFLYQLYGCTIGQPSNPKYIFQHNDLHAQTQKVWEIRKKFNKQILSNMDDSIQQ